MRILQAPPERTDSQLPVQETSDFCEVEVNPVAIQSDDTEGITTGASGVTGVSLGVSIVMIDAQDSSSCHKTYNASGTVYFANAKAFVSKFNAATDPQHITLSLVHANIADADGWNAVRNVQADYEKLGKRCHVVTVT